jgi:hypothetical protein
MAYIFLLINGFTGLPSWSFAAVSGQMSVSVIQLVEESDTKIYITTGSIHCALRALIREPLTGTFDIV